MLHRMACSRKEIQMAIQYRIVPFIRGYLFNPCRILTNYEHWGIFMLGSKTRQRDQHDSRDSEKKTQRSQNSAPASPDFTKTAEANKKPDDAWKTCYDRKGDGKTQTNVCLEPCHLCNSPNHTGNQRRENELARHMALIPLGHDIDDEGNRSRCWDTDKMRKNIVLDTQILSMKYPSLSQSVQIQSKCYFQLEELTAFSWNPIAFGPKLPSATKPNVIATTRVWRFDHVYTSRAGQTLGGSFKRDKKTIRQRKNVPIECAHGDQPMRCPTETFVCTSPRPFRLVVVGCVSGALMLYGL